MPETVWCLVDDFGEGRPSVGPFASFAAAAAHDPTDGRFEIRQVTRTQWDASVAEIEAECEWRVQAAQLVHMAHQHPVRPTCKGRCGVDSVERRIAHAIVEAGWRPLAAQVEQEAPR